MDGDYWSNDNHFTITFRPILRLKNFQEKFSLAYIW
jgi:hypothetical protein